MSESKKKSLGYIASFKDEYWKKDAQATVEHLEEMGVPTINYLGTIGMLIISAEDEKLEKQAVEYLESLVCIARVEPNREVKLRPPERVGKRLPSSRYLKKGSDDIYYNNDEEE